MVYFAPDDGGARGCNVFGDSFQLGFAGEPLNKGFDYHNVDPSSVLFAGKQVLRVINGGHPSPTLRFSAETTQSINRPFPRKGVLIEESNL
tara:strand:+ start:74 stop:346 length:273 start_codon:yes stop_codon:yes gene_type:complete